VFGNFLAWTSLDRDPPNYASLHSWDDRHVPPHPVRLLFKLHKQHYVKRKFLRGKMSTTA
jgi:hypothetical protein